MGYAPRRRAIRESPLQGKRGMCHPCTGVVVPARGVEGAAPYKRGFANTPGRAFSPGSIVIFSCVPPRSAAKKCLVPVKNPSAAGDKAFSPTDSLCRAESMFSYLDSALSAAVFYQKNSRENQVTTFSPYWNSRPNFSRVGIRLMPWLSMQGCILSGLRQGRPSKMAQRAQSAQASVERM